MKFNRVFMCALFYAGSSLAQETVPRSRVPGVQVPVVTRPVTASDACQLTEADEDLNKSLHEEIIDMLRATPAAIEQYRQNDINDCALASFAYRKKILEKLKDSGYE